MRIIFMGTPDFAVPVLNALTQAGHDVALAVTQPDKKRGRGKAVTFSPVKEAAAAAGIPIIQPVRIRDEEWLKVLRSYEPELCVVAAFGQILPKTVLELPKYGCINVHASLLPKYRGAAPIQWSIIGGEEKTGVTIMQMNEGLDTGDVLASVEVPITPEETGGSLHDKLAAAGAALLIPTIEAIEEGRVHPVAQSGEGACYASMLTKESGNIDWTKDASSIERLIRGLNPWPSAYTRWNGKLLKIWKAAVCEAAPEADNAVYGELVRVDGSYIYVRTGQGVLRIDELQPEGKKRMETAAFLRGYPMETGMRLGEASYE